eukprot:1907637-Prymnesium_polylepis.2
MVGVRGVDAPRAAVTPRVTTRACAWSGDDGVVGALACAVRATSRITIHGVLRASSQFAIALAPPRAPHPSSLAASQEAACRAGSSCEPRAESSRTRAHGG